LLKAKPMNNKRPLRVGHFDIVAFQPFPATSRASAIFRPAAGSRRAVRLPNPNARKKSELLEVEPGRFVRCPFWK
jgi:hypothetical protein